jgi:hypothetical protein
MIAIKFSPQYEDRVGLFWKHSDLKNLGVEWNLVDLPFVDFEKQCLWLFEYKHPNFVNTILSNLEQMKVIMGVPDLQFQYCYNRKEFETQLSEREGRNINWFAI